MAARQAIAALVLFLIELALIFIAQLYSNAALWLLSYLILIVVLYLGWRIESAAWRVSICLAAAVFINRNFFLLAMSGSSAGTLVGWGLTLVALNLIVLLLLIWMVRRMRPAPQNPS